MNIRNENLKVSRALTSVIGNCRWEAVALAYGYIEMQKSDIPSAARCAYEHGASTIKKSKEMLELLQNNLFDSVLPPRKKTGSAENPITKLFPATITEQRFLNLLDELHEERRSITFTDDRHERHSLTDFTLHEGANSLPINIKNAGTRFERAQQLVGLSSDDCVPIPAYKANAAIESQPNLLYLVSVDYNLINDLNSFLEGLFTPQESIVWRLLNSCVGSNVQTTEDSFVFSMVRKYWDEIINRINNAPFHAISARKAIRILQTNPQRTPGIGLRAWGTGATAEVNIHVSIRNEMTPWESIRERLISRGLSNIIEAVNRIRVEEVYDPEI